MPKLKRTFPNFEQPGRVTFGAGSLRTLGEYDGLQQTALFVSGQAAIQQRLFAVLGKQGVDVAELHVAIKPSGEPTREMISEGAKFLSTVKPKRIVAIGGGSVMDWSRLAWLDWHGMLESPARLAAITRDHPERPKMCLVPTTCGSGAEAASVAVYEDSGHKIPIASSTLIADQVILDAHFLNDLDNGTLECHLCDALSHAVEAFVSIVPCYLAKEAGLSAFSILLENYDTDPGTQRNERLLEASYFAGLAAAHCSVGVVHALAHSLAAYQVRHGVANAVGLIAGILANSDTPAMAQLVRRSGVGSVDQLVQLLRPITRKAIGVSDRMNFQRLLYDETIRADLVERVKRDVCLRTNPRPLNETEINQFLDYARSELEAA